MTALAELTTKAERSTGSRVKAVEMVNHWCAQITDSAGHMNKKDAAAYILKELERRRRAKNGTPQ